MNLKQLTQIMLLGELDMPFIMILTLSLTAVGVAIESTPSVTQNNMVQYIAVRWELALHDVLVYIHHNIESCSIHIKDIYYPVFQQCYAPINVLPHHPPPPPLGRKWRFTGELT